MKELYSHKVAYCMDSIKPRLTDLPESEFLSFLYSERERENSLSQYQGWNNWALIGALITVLSLAYGALKSVGRIDWIRCSYYATGGVTFFLAYHSWLKFFKRERGYDFTRVRLLKEMVPWIDSGLAVVTAALAIVLILIYDKPSSLFWSWVIVFFVQILIVVIALINRNRLVPSYFYRPYFPSVGWNIAYDGLAGGLFAWIWSSSFKRASWDILNPEFEVGVCLGAAIVIVYFLIRIKFENKAAEQFDAIVDRYIYTDVSKEDTFNTILCNRMGYGVLDVCRIDLSKVQEMSAACEKKVKELEEIKTLVLSGEYDFSQIPVYNAKLSSVLNDLDKAIKQSERLAARLNEMVRTAPVLDHVTAINTIFDTNHELHQRIGSVQQEIGSLATLINREFKKYYCQKANTLCPDLTCINRNDPMEKKYVKELRRRRFLQKLHLGKYDIRKNNIK